MSAAVAEADNDLKALYQEIILDHSRHPRNARLVEHATCNAKGNNPLCGDRITVTARVSGGAIEDVGAEGKGCAISLASASLMTEALKGVDLGAARKLFDAVHGLCTGTADIDAAKRMVPPELEASIDKLASLSGVKHFPVRVKCATLPWHSLMRCLDGHHDATTEVGE